MRQETCSDYEDVYQCPKDGCIIRGVAFPPAYCPVCHNPVYERHPKYYLLRKGQENVSKSEYIDYSSISNEQKDKD